MTSLIKEISEVMFEKLLEHGVKDFKIDPDTTDNKIIFFLKDKGDKDKAEKLVSGYLLPKYHTDFIIDESLNYD